MERMPVLFVGHGSPMNAIENNRFTKGWAEIAQAMPKPQAILAVSAHWCTAGVRLNDLEQPKLIYDMYGFPKALYELAYKAPGSFRLAHDTLGLITRSPGIDNSWGIDHGTWSVLTKMYPDADIPVVQLSLDQNAKPDEHYAIGKELQSLRDQGVLILGSGNVVHNLGRCRFDKEDGEAWAYEFDAYVKDAILKGDHQAVMDYKKAGRAASLSFMTTEHYDPLLYMLGASDAKDKVKIYNEACVMGALSMTSYLFDPK